MLARLYHAHHQHHLEDLPFWLSLAETAGGPVLELGCGAGRLTLPVAEAGYHVIGLDHDRAMLDVLRARTTGETPARVDVLQAEMGRFRLACRFPSIFLPCNTLSALPAPLRPDVFQRVQEHLAPGGRFAASLLNPIGMAETPREADTEPETHFPHPDTGYPVQVSSAWRVAGEELTVHWMYDHLLPDGRVERWATSISHTLMPPEAYTAEMAAAGLHVVARYGDFDRSAYSPASPHWIVVAGLKGRA